MNEQDIWQALESVMDPEIPTISMVDMGIKTGVKTNDTFSKAFVEMTPTFSVCPAIKIIEQMVKDKLLEIRYEAV